MPISNRAAEFCRYVAAIARGKQIVHLLHISKTGGTAVKSTLRGHLTTTTSAIFLHEHSWHLRHVAQGEKAVMFFRHPIPRFVSAFNSRQRCGRPHSVYRKFGLCRVCLREMAHRGELPGVTKSSW